MNPKDILASMNLRQKVQLVCGQDFWHSARIESAGIPSLTFSDGPHGLRYQADAADHLGMNQSLKASCFPTASALANSWDPLLAGQIGRALGKEAARLGVDVLLGPGINLIRNPKGGRNFEYFSEDPLISGVMGSAMVQGIQTYVSACPKHYLLNSQETSRMTIDEHADEQTLHELYLPAFRRVIQEAHPDWIMTSYNKVDGTYASEHQPMIDLLRQMGFQGAVVTDWGGGNSIVKAVEAGSSLEMPGTRGQSAHTLYQAVLRKEAAQEQLDARVLEVLEAIDRQQQRKTTPPPRPNRTHHHILAVEAAAQSAVLLQNDGILPLHQQTIAWIGPFQTGWPIQGGGSSQVDPAVVPDFEQLLKQSPLHSCGVAPGYSVDSDAADPRLEQQALKLAKKADVIVFGAMLPVQEQLEGLDRRAQAIPPHQVRLYRKLLALKKPVILVDAIAGPIEIPDAHRFAAILYLGLAGQGSLEALLRILSGSSTPEGFLAQTFAKRWEDHPSSAVFPAVDGISERTEGMRVGYRGIAPDRVLFPLGHGLSYTSMTCTQPKLNLAHDQITCQITNTGTRPGSFLAQIYVQKPGRDYRELVGFQKVRLKAQHTQRVTIPIDPTAWQVYSPVHHQWECVNGRFQVELSQNAQTPLYAWSVEQQDGIRAILPASSKELTENTQMTEPVQQEAEEASRAFPAASEPVSVPLKELPVQPPVLSLEDPLHQFAAARDPWIAGLVKALVAGKESSLQRKEPNLVLISLADMPLKGFPKVTPEYFSEEMMAAFLKQANTPSFSHGIQLVRTSLNQAGRILGSMGKKRSDKVPLASEKTG